MTAWHRGPLLAWDTESTGVDPTQARIVTATVLVIGEQPGQIRQKTWLLAQDVDIPDEATAVHGITTERMNLEGVPVAPALQEILTALQQAWRNRWPVIAFNHPYDATLLDHELARNGLPSIAAAGGPGLVIDPLVIDRRLDKYRKGKRTLTACCEHYKVRLDGAHDASFDAVAAARVAWRLAEVYPLLTARPLEQLQADQARWHEEWAVHFEHYLRTKGNQPDAVISRDWPYTPARAQVPA